jgi:hypothetical protein
MEQYLQAVQVCQHILQYSALVISILLTATATLAQSVYT